MEYNGDSISESEWAGAEMAYDDDDDFNRCYVCGCECDGDYCLECQEDGSEYFDRMKAAAESCGKSAGHRTTSALSSPDGQLPKATA